MRPLWPVLFVLTLVAVTTLALWPQPSQVIDTGWDKLNHALAFGVLTALAQRAWGPATWRRELLIGAGLLAWGALIEVAQHFEATRTADGLDLLADAAGIVIVLALARVLGGVRRRRPGSRCA